MPERMIVARDGNSSYVGYVAASEDFQLGEFNSGEAILLYRARRLITAHVSMGPGRMIQQVNVFPIDEELGPIDVWITPVSIYFPTQDGERRLVEIIKRCEQSEVVLRAKEAGIETPGQ